MNVTLRTVIVYTYAILATLALYASDNVGAVQGNPVFPDLTGKSLTFDRLGFLPGTPSGTAIMSYAYDVSSDGAVVVGQTSGTRNRMPFIWENGVMTEIPDNQDGSFGAFTHARGVSSDGQFVTGNGSNNDPFIWDETNGMIAIKDNGGANIQSDFSYKISSDGTTVAGYGVNSNRNREAYRATISGGFEGLGFLEDAFDNNQPLSEANDISGDGFVVVGYSRNSSGSFEAFRWDETTGMVGLGFIPNGSNSLANGISQNGLYIVGQTNGVIPGEATGGTVGFIWDAVNGMVGLSDLPGGAKVGWANGVSNDGKRIVGRGRSGFTGDLADIAVMWDLNLSSNPFSLNDFVDDAGIDRDGFLFKEATAISDDGSTIVGWGINSVGQDEAFRLQISMIPEPQTYVIIILAAFGLIAWRERL